MIAALLLTVTIFMQGPGALQPGTGIVTGAIKVDGGGSAAGIRVGAVATDDPTASSFLSVAETDSAGRFRLTNIPAGHYYIVAGRLNDLYFFPNGNTPTQATEINVEAAKTRADVNFTVGKGSSRPSQPTTAAGGLNAMTQEEFIAYRQITLEPNVDRRLTLLQDFEKKFPKSAAMPNIITSLMSIYVTKSDPAKAVEYGEKFVRLYPENVNALIQVSRNYTILQTNPPKAIEYAQKAATLAAKMKTQPPQNGLDAVTWRTWTASMDTAAQANLSWVKKSADYQQQQFLNMMRPRRAK